MATDRTGIDASLLNERRGAALDAATVAFDREVEAVCSVAAEEGLPRGKIRAVLLWRAYAMDPLEAAEPRAEAPACQGSA